MHTPLLPATQGGRIVFEKRWEVNIEAAKDWGEKDAHWGESGWTRDGVKEQKVKGGRWTVKGELWTVKVKVKVTGERGKVENERWKVKGERWKVKGERWKVMLSVSQSCMAVPVSMPPPRRSMIKTLERENSKHNLQKVETRTIWNGYAHAYAVGGYLMTAIYDSNQVWHYVLP